jgi:tetratricopeptide (TPR) repeat protein
MDKENSELWVNKGAVYYEMEDYKSAIKCYDQAIILNPENTNAMSNMGAAFTNSGDLESGMKCFNRALKINPLDVNARINRDKLRDFLLGRD